MAFTLVRNAVGPAAGGALAPAASRWGRRRVRPPSTTARSRTCSSGCAPGSTASTAASSRRSTRRRCGSRRGARRARRHPTGWCLPCVPYAGPRSASRSCPRRAAAVWIEFEGGDVSFPIWAGGYWREGEVPDAAGRRQGDGHRGSREGELANSKSTTAGDPSRSRTRTETGRASTPPASPYPPASPTTVASSSSVSVNHGALEVSGDRGDRLRRRSRGGLAAARGAFRATARQDYAYPFQVDPGSRQTSDLLSPSRPADGLPAAHHRTRGAGRPPRFGCGPRSLVFAPNTAARPTTVQLRVGSSLQQWLGPRIEVAGPSPRQPAGTSGQARSR